MSPFRTICFALLLTSIPFLLPGQFTLGFGYELDGFDAETGINNYVRTYNSYMEPILDEPLREMGKYSMQGFFGTGGYRWTSPGFTIGALASYGNSQYTNTSQLRIGLGQEHILRFNDLNILFSGGPVLGKFLFLEAVLQFGFRNSTMEVATLYPDGSRSLSYEYDINGIYSTFTPCYEVGGSAGIRVGRLLVSARVTQALNILEGDPDLGAGTSLSDFDVNRFRSSEFPRDFGKWVDEPLNYDETNAVFSRELRGLRMALSVEFFLGKPFKN